MPWHLPEDLTHFREATTGGALIMGARTWRSLPVRPLADRLNCVVSRDTALAEHVFASPEAAIRFARNAGHDRIHGIGGAGIYAAMLPLADRLLITEVDLTVADADTYFPAIDQTAWTCRSERTLRSEAPRCVVRELVRVP